MGGVMYTLQMHNKPTPPRPHCEVDNTQATHHTSHRAHNQIDLTYIYICCLPTYHVAQYTLYDVHQQGSWLTLTHAKKSLLDYSFILCCGSVTVTASMWGTEIKRI